MFASFATPNTKASQMKTPSAPIKRIMRNISRNHQGAPPRALFVIPSTPTKSTELMIPDAPTRMQLASATSVATQTPRRLSLDVSRRQSLGGQKRMASGATRASVTVKKHRRSQ
uniref:Uncharacterized protein n=1 Tax=Caenorhabditis japonica TaxID=281687 RepID=A0A8R1EI09_CAEJA